MWGFKGRRVAVALAHSDGFYGLLWLLTSVENGKLRRILPSDFKRPRLEPALQEASCVRDRYGEAGRIG
ncbi:hypothetical protein RE428_28400 [Marinobacter nanhaiticus D15-8W]|nr:hypothetical protein RE428_28400 [Marinobacter nanhaiticus D15-8W]